MNAKRIAVLMMALGAIAPVAAHAQSADDVVVMRRPIAQPHTAGVGGIIGGVIDAITGPTYAWYNVCSGEDSLQVCLSIGMNGDLGIVEDDRCAIPQTLAYVNNVAAKSLELLGSSTTLVKAGPRPPRRNCVDPETRGYGYACVGEGAMQCFSLDSYDSGIMYVENDKCARPQKSGLKIDGMLKANGLHSVGTGVTPDVCRSPASAYGRKDECAWTTSAQGVRTMALKQSCFKVAQDRSVTPATMAECSKAPASTANDALLLRYINLRPADSAPQLTCANKDAAAQLTSRVVKDVTGRNADGYLERRIDYTFSCTKLGLPLADATPCREQFLRWNEESQANAWAGGLSYEATGDLNSGMRKEIYVKWSDWVNPNPE